MREDYAKIRTTQISLVVIVPTDKETAAGYWRRNNIPVVALADPERDVMIAYGQEYALPKMGWMPATLALDAEHNISYAHYGKNQRDIATSEEILSLMKELAQAA